MEITKEQILTGVLAVLIILSAFQTYQLKNLSGKISGTGAVSGSSGGETYEQMMERMHGSGSTTSAASAPASSAPADTGTGMVGGC